MREIIGAIAELLLLLGLSTGVLLTGRWLLSGCKVRPRVRLLKSKTGRFLAPVWVQTTIKIVLVLAIIEGGYELAPRRLQAVVEVLLAAIAIGWHVRANRWLKVLAGIAAAAVGELWLVWPGVWTFNVRVLVMCLGLVLVLGRLAVRVPNRVLFLLAFAAMAADIYLVFVWGGWQAQLASPSPELPPTNLTIGNLFGTPASIMLGNGDIYLPGALVMAAVYMEDDYPGITSTSLTGFACGIMATLTIGVMADSMQPALAYIMPLIMLGMLSVTPTRTRAFLKLKPGQAHVASSGH